MQGPPLQPLAIEFVSNKLRLNYQRSNYPALAEYQTYIYLWIQIPCNSTTRHFQLMKPIWLTSLITLQTQNPQRIVVSCTITATWRVCMELVNQWPPSQTEMYPTSNLTNLATCTFSTLPHLYCGFTRFFTPVGQLALCMPSFAGQWPKRKWHLQMNESVDRAACKEPAIQSSVRGALQWRRLSFPKPMQSLVDHSSVPSETKKP